MKWDIFSSTILFIPPRCLYCYAVYTPPSKYKWCNNQQDVFILASSFHVFPMNMIFLWAFFAIYTSMQDMHLLQFSLSKASGRWVVKCLTEMQTRYVEYEWEYVFMAGVLSLQTNNECLTAAWNASYSLCAILCVELLVELQKHLIKLSRLHFWRFSFAGKKEEDNLLLAEEREAAPVREVRWNWRISAPLSVSIMRKVLAGS